MPQPLTGEITTILGALGQDIYDEGGLGLLGLAGPTYRDEKYPGELYRAFHRSGVAVAYEKKRKAMSARAVFIYIVPQDDADAYPTPDQLIDGLVLTTAQRKDIQVFFGEAALSEDAFDIFTVEGGYLNFEFDSEYNLTLITAMRQVPGL